jgi:hypothetical protein
VRAMRRDARLLMGQQPCSAAAFATPFDEPLVEHHRQPSAAGPCGTGPAQASSGPSTGRSHLPAGSRLPGHDGSVAVRVTFSMSNALTGKERRRSCRADEGPSRRNHERRSWRTSARPLRPPRRFDSQSTTTRNPSRPTSQFRAAEPGPWCSFPCLAVTAAIRRPSPSRTPTWR